MRIDRVTSESFAGVRDFNVEFKDGVNIVYGKNEAGKSTLVNLISRTLFQNARIDGRSDKSFRDSYFPTQRKGSAAAGDSIDGSVTISDGEDTYKLTKEWGADPRCKLTTPDGTISGQDSVNDRLRELLQYGEGVYNELLLSSQHNTDAALETLMNAKDKSATRQEIVDAVSAAFAESGGASLDAIENAIKGKIAEIEGAHWDADRDAPVKKAGKWKTGIGTILKAYYDLEDAQKNVSSLHELEQSVTEAMQKYEHACTAVEEAEDAYNRFNAFAGALAARRDRAKIIKRLEDDVKKYATILAEWPKLVKQLDAARVLKAEKSASELKSKYEKVKAIASELDALKARAVSAKSPSADELAAVKAAQRAIAELENKLCGMNLNAAVTMLNSHSVEVRSLRTGEALTVEDGSAAITEAVVITVPGVMELRLTPADVDLVKNTITINKTFQRINGRDVIWSPKTPKSNRVVTIPQTLANCLKEYMDKCYEIQPDDRLFPYTKSFLNHEMLRGCKKSGVKKIRVHDLRHSHASLLIEMGCQPLLIADRLGHEKIQTTLNTYSHLYPNKQAEVAAQLENVMNGTTVPNGSQMAGVANL